MLQLARAESRASRWPRDHGLRVITPDRSWSMQPSRMTAVGAARRWQEIITQMRKSPVEGAPQNLACALAWCGMVDVERDELIDDDFASAACKERRWFTVSRGFGLGLLGQVFLIWEGVIAPAQAQRGAL